MSSRSSSWLSASGSLRASENDLFDLERAVVGLDEPALQVVQVEHQPVAGEQTGASGVPVVAGEGRVGRQVGTLVLVGMLGQSSRCSTQR